MLNVSRKRYLVLWFRDELNPGQQQSLAQIIEEAWHSVCAPHRDEVLMCLIVSLSLQKYRRSSVLAVSQTVLLSEASLSRGCPTSVVSPELARSFFSFHTTPGVSSASFGGHTVIVPSSSGNGDCKNAFCASPTLATHFLCGANATRNLSALDVGVAEWRSVDSVDCCSYLLVVR